MVYLFYILPAITIVKKKAGRVGVGFSSQNNLAGRLEEEMMKSLAFLEQVDHERKVAIYVAEQDGKMRNFAYKERNEPRALIAAVAQSPFSAASIEKGENWFLMSEVGEKDKDTSIYSLSSGAKGKDTDMWGMGPLKDLLDTLSSYGITEEGGWFPVHVERKGWLSRIQQQEDKMAEQATTAMKPHRGSLPKEAQVRVVLGSRSKTRGKKRRK